MAHLSQAPQQFAKSQADILIRSALPEGCRAGLRWFEVAAVLNDFSPQLPLLGPTLGGKSFYYFAVTDWSLFVLRMSGKATHSVASEIPWLLLRNMVRAHSSCAPYTRGRFLT